MADTFASIGPRLALARLSVAGCTPFLALVSGDRMQPLQRWRSAAGEALRGTGSSAALLADWPHNAALLRHATLGAGAAPLAGFKVHAPLQPRHVYCTIGNYRAQVLEAALDAEPPGTAASRQARRDAVLAGLDQRRASGEPYAVVKPTSTLSDPYGPLAVPPDQQTLDWEVEVGVVIGRTARHVPAAQALSCVAGYCTVNDITLRQRLFRTDLPAMGTDFLQAKGGPGWLPVGPWWVPAEAVPDPASLRLQLRLNGTPMQDGRADDMVFGIAEQIAYLSRHVQLEPGDLVCTGSPAGFGQHHRRFLHPGDRLEAEVIGLGAQCIELTAAPL
jgi:2-keto-4-pentenoate hydratase/2-oxohepta-3-ene-1,7-dioic acid hydratase in catechol pathway